MSSPSSCMALTNWRLKREMAHSWIYLAPTGHRWRKYRRMVWRESLASQDYAQEVQIRNTFDYGYTNRFKYIYDHKGRSCACLWIITKSVILPYRAVSNLQSNVHIAPLAFNVVSIEHFRIPTFQDTALTTGLTVVQAFPCFEYIGESFFLDGIIYLWRNHRFYKIGQALFQLINNSASLVFESIRSSITTKFCLR